MSATFDPTKSRHLDWIRSYLQDKPDSVTGSGIDDFTPYYFSDAEIDAELAVFTFMQALKSLALQLIVRLGRDATKESDATGGVQELADRLASLNKLVAAINSGTLPDPTNPAGPGGGRTVTMKNRTGF